MNLFVVLLVYVGLHCTCAYRMYYVEDECNNPKTLQKVVYKLPGSGPDSVGELRSNRFGTYSRMGRKCMIKLAPPKDHGIVVTVLKVDFRNHDACKDYIKIYDDENDDGEKLCGYQERGLTSQTFYSDDVIKVLYHTSEGGMGFNDGFRLIFTVTKMGESDLCTESDEFRCANSRCIWSGVTCDELNNCGDASDERTDELPHCSRLNPVAIAAVVLGITSFVAIIIAMCLCCCRVKPDPSRDKPFLLNQFPSRPNGGYLPLPGYNCGSVDSRYLQPMHSSYADSHPSAPYNSTIPMTHPKANDERDKPPAYSE